MESSTRAISEELRRFLKYYELTAINSLGGPSNQKHNELSASLASAVIEKTDAVAASERTQRSLDDASSSVGHQPLAYPVPVMTPRDQSSERLDTTLKGEIISCFLIGGEKRLCFPQVLNSVLLGFDLHDINKACTDLNIHCTHCNKHQLEVLKLTGVLPLSLANCNLITNTDAERLCNYLAQQHKEQRRQRENNALIIENSSTTSSNGDNELKKSSLSKAIFVCHECFGECNGRYYPDKFTSLSAKCIQCDECSEHLSPDKFVVHSHRNQETRTCHWGFDSGNWRFYIHLMPEVEDVKEYQTILNEMRSRFKDTTKKRPAPDDGYVAEKRPRLEPVKILSQSSPILDRPLINNNNNNSSTTNVGSNAATTAAAANAVQLLLCDPLLTMAYYHLLANARFGGATVLPYVSTTMQTQHLVSTAAVQTAVIAAPQVPLSVEEAAVALLKLSPQTCVIDKSASLRHQVEAKQSKMVKNDICNFQHNPEPFKKHLLSQFIHEQQMQNVKLENANAIYRANESPKTETEDTSASLEILLNHYVKDPDGLRRITDKLHDARRTHDDKMEILMAQNRILHQEIAYLRNRQNSTTSSSIVAP